MEMKDYISLVEKHFGFLMRDYGFSIVYCDYDYYSFGNCSIIMESGDCRIRFCTDHGSGVILDCGLVYTPYEQSLESRSLNPHRKWCGPSTIIDFINNDFKRDNWEKHNWKEGTERQMVRLTHELEPYWDKIVSFFQKENFKNKQKDLEDFRYKRKVREWGNSIHFFMTEEEQKEFLKMIIEDEDAECYWVKNESAKPCWKLPETYECVKVLSGNIDKIRFKKSRDSGFMRIYLKNKDIPKGIFYRDKTVLGKPQKEIYFNKSEGGLVSFSPGIVIGDVLLPGIMRIEKRDWSNAEDADKDKLYNWYTRLKRKLKEQFLPINSAIWVYEGGICEDKANISHKAAEWTKSDKYLKITEEATSYYKIK